MQLGGGGLFLFWKPYDTNKHSPSTGRWILHVKVEGTYNKKCVLKG
jgi:hypothetical protein